MLKKLSFFFTLFALLLTASSHADSPREAWVVYATENYFPLLEVTIASIHEFSTRPVIAVGVNADIPFSQEKYPRLSKLRIEADLNERFIYYYKPVAILAADLDYGIYLDADAIVNKDCDDLFQYCYEVETHPLCPVHEQDAYVLPEAMEFFGVDSRSMHYIHTDVIIYSKACTPFLETWRSMCMDHARLGIPVWDETFLNIALWKIGATKHLFCCDPYNAYFDNYLSLNKKMFQNPPFNHWYVFHGNKDADRGWQMFKRLIEKHSDL